MNKDKSITNLQSSITNDGIDNSKFVICNSNMGVPQGSGYPLYLFCKKTKKDAATIPHAKNENL